MSTNTSGSQVFQQDSGTAGREVEPQISDTSGNPPSDYETTDHAAVDVLHQLLTDEETDRNWISADELQWLIESGHINQEWLVQEINRQNSEVQSITWVSDTAAAVPTDTASVSPHKVRILRNMATLSLLFAVLVAVLASQSVVSVGLAVGVVSILTAIAIGATKTWLNYN